MTGRLPSAFHARPFAHRGLHDRADGRAENGLAAFEAAVAAGYAVELDVQASADGEAMAFHDYDLARLTGRDGRVDALSAEALRAVPLIGGGTIPDLATALARIDGRAPVLVEIKDQTGDFGPTDGALERRVCDVVRAAGGAETCAVMSFNPHSIRAVRDHAPELRRGLVSYDFEHPHDAHVAADWRRDLATLSMFDACGADFASYGLANLDAPALDPLRARGVPIFTWTVRSAAQAQAARVACDQITFEGFLP